MTTSLEQLSLARKKKKSKISKTCFQLIVIAIITFFLYDNLFFTSHYQPVANERLTNTLGFIALAYSDVSQDGAGGSISHAKLADQLTAFKALGFETISQQDILSFYNENTRLPERALFLSFDHLQVESSAFIHGLLEELNYQATLFTYANQFESKSRSELTARQLERLLASGYWELGSNGFQLTYINGFNESGMYLGERSDGTVNQEPLSYFNHSLTDYLRDPFFIPRESRSEMEDRIKTEYDQAFATYSKIFADPPSVYALSRPNVLFTTMEEDVAAINELMIRQYYHINFNRNRSGYNQLNDNPFDLSRLQVSSDWSVANLLMRIQAETGWQFTIKSDNSRHWDVQAGVIQFDQELIELTSFPDQLVEVSFAENLPNTFTISYQLKQDPINEQIASLWNLERTEGIHVAIDNEQIKVYTTDAHNILHSLVSRRITYLTNGEPDTLANLSPYFTAIQVKYQSPQELSTLSMSINLSDDMLTISVNDWSTTVALPFTANQYQLTFSGQALVQHAPISEMVISSLNIKSDNQFIYPYRTEQQPFLHSFTSFLAKLLFQENRS
ncbi:hypothetical protein SAMN04488134_10546 [Amphibacillus marinus]|uniref:Polysaccharide deacetylase n=1 Tax=Amphibacillus marinus TaxID=872970 RepID=A0A1H8MY02_9BACI|nr:hypothetical protein [Amphibacillus marinus]SEO22237.1 hypothetical protein SAMN04488134_10546 [Amphibacillus marinus]